MILPIQQHELSDRLVQLTGMQKPYFAIENPVLDANGQLSADILPDPLQNDERCILGAAKAAQHMAVLGSSCLALHLPSMPRQYFLIKEANLVRNVQHQTDHVPFNLDPITLKAEAEVRHIDMRNKAGTVKSYLYTADRQLLYQMSMAYRWVNVRVYERLFRKKRVQATMHDSTSAVPGIPVFIHEVKKNCLSGTIGEIDPAWCAGHFDHFPNLPMSGLGDVLTRMAAMQLKLLHKNRSLEYLVKQAITTIHQPAFAGESVFLQSKYLGVKQGAYQFQATASNAKGEDLAKAILTLGIHNGRTGISPPEFHYFPSRKHQKAN